MDGVGGVTDSLVVVDREVIVVVVDAVLVLSQSQEEEEFIPVECVQSDVSAQRK